MELHPDFKDLLEEFAREKVRYALIGGYAVGYHAKPRATKDLDLLVSLREDNVEPLVRALTRFGAPQNVIAAAYNRRSDDVLYFGIPPLRIDLLATVDGIDTESALERAVRTTIDGLDLYVIAASDLIANKRASGRKQDLADVELLEKMMGSR